MPTLATTRVTEALTSLVTLPTAQSVICDNYSQSYLFIQEAGVYVPPYNSRIISLPSPLSSITLMWQTPPTVTPPPIGNPPGYASCIFSSNAAETSLPQPLYAAQSAPVPLGTQGGNTPFNFQVAIPGGTQSLIIWPLIINGYTTEILGVTTGNVYFNQALVPTQEISFDIDPTDTHIEIINTGTGYVSMNVVASPFLAGSYPMAVTPYGDSLPVSVVSGSFPPSPAASVMNNNGVIISGSTAAITTSLVGSFLIGITAGTVRYLRFVKFQLASPSNIAGEDLFLYGHTSGKQITPIRLVANALASSVDEARILDPPWDLVSLFPGDSQVDVYVYLVIAGTAAAYQAEATP